MRWGLIPISESGESGCSSQKNGLFQRSFLMNKVSATGILSLTTIDGGGGS